MVPATVLESLKQQLDPTAQNIYLLLDFKYKFLWYSFKSSLPELLEENNFLEALISMLTKFCYEFKRARQIETNIALEAMEERDKHAVLFAKKGSQCSTLITSTSFEPQITNGLVAALADLTLTLIESYQSIIDRLPLWTELGLFRLFFRCLYASSSDYEATLSLRASVCALLSRVVTVCTKTHAAIADTRDCIGALVSVMSITSTDKSIDISKNVFLPQGYTLLGALCSSDKGCSVVWKSLKDGHMYGFFRNVIIALSQMKNLENCDLHKSIFYCLSHLLNPKETTPLDHKPSIEDIPTDAILREEDEVRNSDVTLQRNGITKYLSEELCKVIFGRMQDAMTRIQADLLSRDDYWVSAQTALCAALILSPQARTYANELGFAAAMVSAIANVRNTLTVQGASVEMIKNKDKNPSLQTLNLLITLLGSFMRDCAEAKESVAEQNIAVSLNKLWPWIMSTEPLRSNTILMMSCMTNGCHKIWNQMHLSVGASCLISEVCRLISRDLSHASRCKSLAIACLRVLSHCLPHAHCRTLIIKSDVLDCVEKIHPALSKRRSQWKDVDKEIESFLEQVSRYPDGQIKLWQYHATLCALVEQKNGLMIKVLANLAYNHYNRAKILASDEVMNVFSSILQSDGNEVAKVDVCRALWALAANNHKAKLSLRASGLATRVRDLAARSSQHDDKLNQLVHYTYSLLSVT